MTKEKVIEKKSPDHYMQWIGGAYYSTESFIKEAKKMGASRRINYIPTNLVKGVTRVYLISDMATDADRQKYKDEVNRRFREEYKDMKVVGVRPTNITQAKYGKLPRGEPRIFGYFVVNSIVYVTSPEVNVPEKLKEMGVEEYEYQEGGFGFLDERGCGSLEVGGIYFISETGMDKVKELASGVELESENVYVLNPPIPLPSGIGRFRGVKDLPEEIRETLEVEVVSHNLNQVKKVKKGKK